MHEGWSMYLLKLAPRTLIQMCCSSTSYILEFAFTETMSKESRGGLQFPTVTGRSDLSLLYIPMCFYHSIFNT